MQTESQLGDIPILVGKGSTPATHEIHIFLAPVNPDSETVEKYKQITQKWNETKTYTGLTEMKACYLCLIFRDSTANEMPVFVIQSSAYYRNNDTQEVIKMCKEQSKYFSDNGFEVIREKIEASAYGINGIPEVSQEIDVAKYFEFHIKIASDGKKEYEDIEPEELNKLKDISDILSIKMNIPVPLSYNANKHQLNQDGRGNQRFLNLRFRNSGMIAIKEELEKVKQLITDSKLFRIIKVISEYVWYDTYPDMDKGWIDYTNEEQQKMLSSLTNKIKN